MRTLVGCLIVSILSLLIIGQGCPSPETSATPVIEDLPSPIEPTPPAVDNDFQPPVVIIPKPPVSQAKTDLDNIGTYLLEGDYDCVTMSGSLLDVDGQFTESFGGISKTLTIGKNLNGNTEHHSLIKFSLGGKPGQASRVELKLLCFASFNPPEIYLERVTSSWGQWAGHIKVDSSSRKIIPKPLSGQWYQIDITDWYTEWENGSKANYGFSLRPVSSTNSGWAQFHSNSYGDQSCQPRLMVITGNPPLTKFIFPFSGKYSPTRLKYYRFGQWWQNQYCLSGLYILKHTGLDIAAEVGEEVRAVKGGRVVYSRPDITWGGYIIIEHPGPYTSTYEHLLPIVTEGDVIVAGQAIGTIVELGNTPSHLHIQLRRGPAEYPWVLRGRLPSQSCVISSGEKEEPAWPEKFINPDALDWE